MQDVSDTLCTLFFPIRQLVSLPLRPGLEAGCVQELSTLGFEKESRAREQRALPRRSTVAARHAAGRCMAFTQHQARRQGRSERRPALPGRRNRKPAEEAGREMGEKGARGRAFFAASFMFRALHPERMQGFNPPLRPRALPRSRCRHRRADAANRRRDKRSPAGRRRPSPVRSASTARPHAHRRNRRARAAAPR